jgi:hypothetical protein
MYSPFPIHEHVTTKALPWSLQNAQFSFPDGTATSSLALFPLCMQYFYEDFVILKFILFSLCFSQGYSRRWRSMTWNVSNNFYSVGVVLMPEK